MRDIRFWKSESGRSPIEDELKTIAKRDPKAFKKIFNSGKTCNIRIAIWPTPLPND